MRVDNVTRVLTGRWLSEGRGTQREHHMVTKAVLSEGVAGKEGQALKTSTSWQDRRGKIFLYRFSSDSTPSTTWF